MHGYCDLIDDWSPPVSAGYIPIYIYTVFTVRINDKKNQYYYYWCYLTRHRQPAVTLSYVATLCRSAFYHMRQLRPIAWSLSTEAAKTSVHAFISSRLDYCNSLLFGAPDVLLRKVQSVQNAATVSCLYYSSCIGCPSDDGSSSRLFVLCISRCLVGHRRIWLLTSNWLSTVVVKIFVRSKAVTRACFGCLNIP